MSTVFTTRSLHAEELGWSELFELRALLEASPGFVSRLPGAPTAAAAAARLLIDRPEQADPSDFYVFGLWRDRQLAGVLSCCAHHPAEGCLTLGTLLVHPEFRGAGFGAEALRGLRGWALDQGVTELRAVTQKGNSAGASFLRHEGFEPINSRTRGGRPMLHFRLPLAEAAAVAV
ncbi:MAG: GNAT family N-acetyltransferase [Alphaproteobacteria bacterium]|nr:GNAT family N-acetyltransferase [Alphaproteobacteria bacterium]